MSDGVDEGSRTRLKEAIEAAQKSDVICYVLLFTQGIYGGRGEGYMKELSEETGGRVIEVGTNYEKLKKGFDQIASELRTQYALGYTPTNAKKDGTFRKIDIKAKQGYKVQARRGYYAIPPR
jgi:VWFA-related protein